MTRFRKTIVIFMAVAILCSLFMVVFAVTNNTVDNATAPSAVNSYEYAKAPDGVYVFCYYGTDPNTDLDIDTSECVVDRLYAYHYTTDSVIEISAQTVSDYSCTQTALYYVTAEQKVYKTDYTGTNHEYLYQCPQGIITMFKSYWDTLYFIEDQTRIVHLDVASKTAQEIWAYEYLEWVFMLNDTQLIATTTEEEDYLYDISSGIATRVSNIVATNMVAAAIKGTTSNNARSTANPTASFSNVVLTQENDVSFPLAEYWADPDGCYETSAPYRSVPSSWFHINNLEGCGNDDINCKRYSGSGECKGFAKYVHDVYAHMVSDTYVDSNGNGWADYDENNLADAMWENRTCITEHSVMENATDIDENTLKLWPTDSKDDTTKIKEFFEGLNTGAYVRYGKYYPDDPTPENGCHSIVFIASDENGIWVYECNQEYDTDSDHGCGVFIQYYPYVRLYRYKFILNYVNHSFNEAPTYSNETYHNVGCDDCVGYLRQEHDDVSTVYYNKYIHKAMYACCGENILREVSHNNVYVKLKSINEHQTVYNCCNYTSDSVAHTGSAEYTDISSSKHRVEYTCCRGYTTAPHVFDSTLQCTLCHYKNDNLLNIEEKEIN